MKKILLAIVALAVVGCRLDSPAISPGENDTSYPCRDENGKRTALRFLCTDEPVGCCFDGTECAPGGQCRAIIHTGPSMVGSWRLMDRAPVDGK